MSSEIAVRTAGQPTERPTWIEKAEAHYKARYVGLYDLPDREGPFHVFYEENPDRSLGHDNYFGLFWRLSAGNPGEVMPGMTGPRASLYVTSAASIRDAVFAAHALPNGTFLVSRFRHDFASDGDGRFVDGGLAYTRSSVPITHTMSIIDGHEVFVPFRKEM